MSFIREPEAEPIPGYRLIQPLGSGGFGEVWKCEAPGGLFKAIKFVYGNLNSLDSEGVRAEQELHALNRVKEVRHPFVLSLDRIENIGGELVIVMELADKSLHDLLQECQAAGQVGIGRDALLRYIRDAAEALDHMIEKHHLLHLDIKPRNLFLISDRVKVADFGLVKHLGRSGGSGILGGVTPLYAPPETLQNKISEQSDQYSLAIVYQELLTGQRPFNGKNARQLALQHLNEEPELRALPEAERPVVARALAKDPARRFPNCLSFVRALYLARTQARPDGSPLDSGGPSLRPKTMADTMEDVLLEHPAGEAVPPLPGSDLGVEISGLGITMAQPNTGALRPTLVIGVGAYGRRALLELRCRFLDRFGDLARIPLVRFLYLDPDPEAVRLAGRGSSEVALTPGEVCSLPLQPVGNYRRRMLDALTDWLPREKLYAVPRSLQTQGSRALGRLAFADNHLRCLARIKRELQQATHPDMLYQSVCETGLALRDSVPRVYVIAAAGGGGSGLLVDLGYAVRRLVAQLRQPNAEIVAFLFCGAPGDPASPRQEQANIYATLTELNHFHDPAIPFAAQYGADGPRILDEGSPFASVYLQVLANRSPAALRDAVAHLGNYIFHDLTTTLGIRLDRTRRQGAPAGATPFRSFGTHAVWFPRGLMLRLAARQACARLLVDWQGTGEPSAAIEVEAACARTLADPELRFEALCARIELAATTPGEGNPAEALTALLSRLEEQTQQTLAQDDAGNWARQALGRVREWVGTGLSANPGSDWRKSKLTRALTQATNQATQAWVQQLSDVAFGLMEHPGRRVAAAESALLHFQQFAQESAASQQDRLQQQAQRTQLAWEHLEIALEHCLAGTGSFSFFGGRSRRQLRVFMDHLAAFTRQRLAEEVIGAGLQFFSLLQGKLGERLQDLTFCRQRLRNVQEAFEAPSDEAGALAVGGVDAPRFTGDTPVGVSPVPSTESFWESIRQSETVRVVLPQGETELERAAARFLATLSLDQWTQLDQMLQDHVLAGLGGLHRACLGSGDLFRNLATPLLDQMASCLGDLLPTTDVAQVEFSIEGNDLRGRVEEYLARAAPLIAGKEPANQHSFLLVPASAAGKSYGEQAKDLLPALHLVRVPGQADLMFCREQGFLTPEDLQRVLAPCRPAYDATAPAPSASPHARFDIVDWLPIDP